VSRVDPNTYITPAVLGPALDDRTTDASVSPAVTSPTDLFHVSIAIPDAATTTYTYALPVAYEIVDVIVRKSGAGAGNTIQIKDGSGNAISDAIAAAVDKTVTRAGTLDVAFNPLTGLTSFQVTASKSAGTMLAAVTVVLRRR